MMSKTKEYQLQMTQEIITMLKDSELKDFEYPWCGGDFQPFNPVTNNIYKGGNIFWLSIMQSKYNYEYNHWATSKQWKSIGGSIIAGSKSANRLQRVVTPFIIKDNEDKDKLIGFGAKCVFNRDQVENIPPVIKIKKESAIINKKKIESWIDKLLIKINHTTQPRAFYNVTDNYIHLPNLDMFHNQDGYYSTKFHEIIHATGHKSRLNLELKSKNQVKEYATEELRAELGASFLCAKFGLKMDKREDHAIYIKSWIKALENNYEILWQTCKDAQLAIDWCDEKNNLESERRVA